VVFSEHYLNPLLNRVARHRLFTGINLIGLTTSMTAALLMFLFAQDETGYDKFWPDVDQIGRLEATFTPSGRDNLVNVTAPGPARSALAAFFGAEIEHVARINNTEGHFKIEQQYHLEEISLVDPEIQDIFSFPAVQGDIAATLSNVDGIVLSESLAAKFFGTKSPLGKTLTLTNNSVSADYVVGAVLGELPGNTHLAVQAMVPIVENRYSGSPWLFEWWFSVSNHTYFKLRNGYTMGHIRTGLESFVNQAFPEAGDPPSSALHFNVTELSDIHLTGVGNSQMKPGGDAGIVQTFTLIAVLIILIAGVNFINLATARADHRAKEVAIRKVLGASRGRLMVRFMGESVLLTTLALILGLLLTDLLLPAYNNFLGKEMSLSLTDPLLALVSLGIMTILGVAAGVYPALVISSYQPTRILGAGRLSGSRNSTFLRGILVVFQFTVSVVLIGATLIIYLQLQYFRSLERGFDETNLMVIENLYRADAKHVRETLKQNVLQLPITENATLVGAGPGTEYVNNTGVSIPGTDISQMVSWMFVDHDFLGTYGISLLAGRDYDVQFAGDRAPDVQGTDQTKFQQNILVNETFLRKLDLGTPEEAIGRVFQRRFRTGKASEQRIVTINLNIAGVVPDVHMYSPRATILPTMYDLNSSYGALVVRFTGDVETAATDIEHVWQSLVPEIPFTYYLAEERLAEDFAREENQTEVFTIFSALAVGIGCLGLFGLASFVAERRTLEIGMRKILGASVAQIARLLVWQFSIPVFIANAIGIPAVVWLMNDWLTAFPYRVDAEQVYPVALCAGVFALLIAWLTVGAHAIRFAGANPVDAIRHQ
jgi:putative ABC transport system permease protein